MTHPPTTSPLTNATPLLPEQAEEGSRPAPENFIGWLLSARAVPSIRADLRRGDRPALDDRAYPHLARFWADQPSIRQPVLLLAAAAAEYSRIGHLGDNQHRFAIVARILVPRGERLEGSSIGARLLAVQRQSLTNTHRMLAGIFRGLNDHGTAINWSALLSTYRSWDHPNPTIRRSVRRRLLEDFFAGTTTDRIEDTNRPEPTVADA